MNIEKTWELLNDIYFVRMGGTEEELKAARIIQDYLSELGLESRIEDFEVEMDTIEHAELKVTKPYEKTYECTGYKGALNTPEEGLTKKLVYFEQDNAVIGKMAKDAILLCNGYITLRSFPKIAKHQPAGFITYNGNIDTAREDVDLGEREFRSVLNKYGQMPGVNIKIHDAMEMLELGAEEVQIKLKGSLAKGISRNVVCDIPGKSDEVVICTAHYDSSSFSKGAYDNGTGAVCLYGMAQYFAKHQPERTIRLVWCGSEERGLLGSHAYIADHPEELDKIVMNVNIDMIGSTMGKRIAVCTSEMGLVNYIDYDAKIKGFPIEVSQGVYSSDSTPFADKNIPAVSFARITPPGGGEIHSRHDVIEHLSKRYLDEDIRYIVQFTEQMATAYVCPAKKEMPENMRKELDNDRGKSEVK
ncbi:MAG: M28 family peptidase [Erysipelotrichaceae bacterium]|nr:M28 family peptidase [Erysipelotrichaceae bacterium]